VRPRVGLLLTPALLAGCAVGPDYHPPAIPAGATGRFVSTDPAVAEAPLPNDWWVLYQDPELNRLIARAFAANTDLKVAEADLAAARAVLEHARNGLFPQTNLQVAGTYGRDPTTGEILELTGREPQTLWIYDDLLDASYELDLFGHVRRTIEQARDSAEAVAAARDDLRVTIAAETARAYGEVCTYGEQIAVAQRALDLATRQYRIVQQRFAAGGGTQFDVTRQGVVVAQQQAALPPLEGQRRAALFELADLLGETPAHAPQEVLSCQSPPELSAPVPVGDGAALLARRPDIREADRKYAAALAGVGVATADLFPRVTINGFYGGAATAIPLLGSNSGLVWGVGPAISWSFPNLYGQFAQLAQARAQSRAALAGYDSVVLQALKETEQALTIYESELEQHAALAQADAEATQAFAQAEDQMAAGAISALDLLTAEQTLISADAALAASNTTLVQDQIGLFKALGGGWK
jgi:NodT family efflux transporter outer membrane factor (OMF) lipoprotein